MSPSIYLSVLLGHWHTQWCLCVLILLFLPKSESVDFEAITDSPSGVSVCSWGVAVILAWRHQHSLSVLHLVDRSLGSIDLQHILLALIVGFVIGLQVTVRKSGHHSSSLEPCERNCMMRTLELLVTQP